MTIFYSDVEPLSNILLCYTFLLLLEFLMKTLFSFLIKNYHAVTGALFCRFCVLVVV